jgi:hypothetical protein
VHGEDLQASIEVQHLILNLRAKTSDQIVIVRGQGGVRQYLEHRRKEGGGCVLFG